MLTERKPAGCLRLLLRAPVALHRLGLGWLLGQRFLLLSHVGRKTGKTHQAIVEVMRHDLDSDSYIVASGRGERSDWLRSVQRTAEVALAVGRRKAPARAVRLTREQAAAELWSYARRQPRAFAELSRLLAGRSIPADEQACQDGAGTIPVVALHVQPQGRGVSAA